MYKSSDNNNITKKIPFAAEGKKKKKKKKNENKKKPSLIAGSSKLTKIERYSTEGLPVARGTGCYQFLQTNGCQHSRDSVSWWKLAY